MIHKEIVEKIIENPNEKKYISLDNEESGVEPIMVDFFML